MEGNSAQEQGSFFPDAVEFLSNDERCPVCSGDNRCRVAKGHLYKGPCWCEEIVISSQILRALAPDSFEPSCLCRFCLEAVARLAHQLENPAEILGKVREQIENSRLLSQAEDFYPDEHGNVVFTAAYHRKRGFCCDNGCRHCPFA